MEWAKMDRDIPFDKTAICDWCGAIGAFDVMGDFYCSNCILSAIPLDDEPDYTIEDGDDE